MARTIPKSLVEDQRTVGFNRSLPKFQYDAGNTAEAFGAIKGMADRYTNILLAEAKKDAVAQGQEDALSEEMVLDEDGNLRPITTPEGGGEYYNAAFEDVAEKRYVRRFGADFEEKARQLSLDPELASDPVAYNKELTRHGELALNAADEKFKGVLGDGVASVIGKYTTDAQVKAFNREFSIGKQEAAADIAASTMSIFDAAVEGRALTADELANAEELKQAGAAYGLSFDVERVLSIANGVYSPVHRAAENMTPSQLGQLQSAIRSGNAGGIPGVDRDAYASMGAAQRRALAADINTMRVLRKEALSQASLAIGDMSLFERATSPAVLQNIGKVTKAQGPIAGAAYGLSQGVLDKDQLSDLLFMSAEDTPDSAEARALLEKAMEIHRSGGDEAWALIRNLGDGEKTLMRTLGDLGTDGLETMFRSIEAVEGDSEQGFGRWSDRHEKAIKKGLEEVEDRHKSRVKHLAWRMYTGAGPEADIDAVLESAATKVEQRWGNSATSNMSALATAAVDQLGGPGAIMDWLRNQNEDAATREGGQFRLHEEAENNAGEVVFSLHYRDDVGQSNWKEIPGTARTLQQIEDGMRQPNEPPMLPWNDDAPRMKDQEEAANKALNMRRAITSGMSDVDLGAAIGNAIPFDKGLDLGKIGVAAKKYFKLGPKGLQKAHDDKEMLTAEEKVGVDAAVLGRLHHGFYTSSGAINRANPPDIEGLRGITRGRNDSYAGFNENSNTYMMRGAIKAPEEYVSLTGPEAIARLPAAVEKASANDYLERAEGEREVRQLSDIKFHYERGGDLIDRDGVLRGLLGHALLKNRLDEDVVPAVRDLAYVSKLKPYPTYLTHTQAVTRAYLLKELGSDALKVSYGEAWDAYGARQAEVSKETIEFVERIKALVFTPVGPLEGMDMETPIDPADEAAEDAGGLSFGTPSQLEDATDAELQGLLKANNAQVLSNVEAEIAKRAANG
jgi:hypothetical protein